VYLLVDIGNQNTKWQCGTTSGIFTSEQPQFACALEREFSAFENLQGVIFVNVAAPHCAEQLQRFATKQLQVHTTQVMSTSHQCGVHNLYKDVAELGADRWATLIGARSLYSGALIIVDSGTAITVDALTAAGDFIGGSILPGFELAQAALWQRAARIDEFSGSTPELPARTTAQAVSSGVIYSISGGVDRLLGQYSDLLSDSPRLFLTGGGASVIAEHSTYLSIQHYYESNTCWT